MFETHFAKKTFDKLGEKTGNDGHERPDSTRTFLYPSAIVYRKAGQQPGITMVSKKLLWEPY